MARGDKYEPTRWEYAIRPELSGQLLNRLEQVAADLAEQLSAVEESGADKMVARLQPVPENIVDVEKIVTGNRKGITSGQDYRDPTVQEAETAIAGISALLRGADADLSSLGMTVTRGWCAAAAKAVTVVYSERSTDRCWGMWVLPGWCPTE